MPRNVLCISSTVCILLLCQVYILWLITNELTTSFPPLLECCTVQRPASCKFLSHPYYIVLLAVKSLMPVGRSAVTAWNIHKYPRYSKNKAPLRFILQSFKNLLGWLKLKLSRIHKNSSMWGMLEEDCGRQGRSGTESPAMKSNNPREY